MGAKRVAKVRLRFSKPRLAALPVPDKGRTYSYDSEVPGLCLCVTSAGTRTFYSYRWAGKPIRVRIGKWPDVSIEAARKEAAKINAAVAAGEDPQATRVAIRGTPTLGNAFDHWLNTYARNHKKDGGRRGESRFGRHLKRWRNKKLSAIRRADIEAWHLRVGDQHGKVEANRALQFLSAIFNRAHGIGFTGANPTRGITRFREVARDRFLSKDELPRFLAATAEEPSETVRDYLLLLLFTGGRRSNVAGMAWADLSLETAVWRIPATDFKTGKPTSVPLSDDALAILRRREVQRGDCPWVLPSERSQSGHVVEHREAWNRVRKAAGLEDLTLHDLRRTAGSWLADAGVSETLIGKFLGHSPGSKATSVYSRVTLGSVRDEVNRVTAAALTAAKTKRKDDGEA